VLQHAFLTPETVHRDTPVTGQATYADLFRLAVAAVDRACRIRPDSLPELALEMLGLEGFLVAAARHLHQIVPLAPASPATRKLLDVLLARRPIPARTGAWTEAARAVAFTSELLATHHTGGTVPVTPEMSELYRTRTQDLALGRVFALLLAACDGGRDLARHAATLLKQQPASPADTTQPILTLRRINELDRLVEKVAHHTRAGLWQVEHAPNTNSELDALATALPHLAESAGPRPVTDPFSAVQTLRRIAYRQAHRLEPASPGSLNDLAQLAASATDPDAEWIRSRNQQCATSLERVQLAHFRDQLAPAHQAWAAAPEGLTTSIRGLTKAPANLTRAFRELHQHLDDPHVAAALVTALPQLGKDAAATLTQLGREGLLLSAGREPGALSIAWRPITPGQTRRLAASYADAGRASRAPAATCRDLQSRTSNQQLGSQQFVADSPRVLRQLRGPQRTR